MLRNNKLHNVVLSEKKDTESYDSRGVEQGYVNKLNEKLKQIEQNTKEKIKEQEKKEHEAILQKQAEEQKEKQEKEIAAAKEKAAQEEAKQREIKQAEILNQKRAYFGKVYVEGVNEGCYLQNLMYDYLNYLPKNLINAFHNGGYTICLSANNINTTYADTTASIQGIFIAPSKQIYIDNREVAVRNATLHEFGHAVDFMLGWTSSTEEWKIIFNEEKDRLNVYSADGHYKSTSTEYFAEVFQEALLRPDNCKSSVPKSYSYIINKINSI